MAYEENLQTISVEASADLSTKQYYPVALDSSGQLAVATVAGQQVIGILQDKPSAAGRMGNVGFDGISKGVAGAAIVVGAELTVNAAGKIVTATIVDEIILGTAFAAAAAADDVIPILLNRYQNIPAASSETLTATTAVISVLTEATYFDTTLGASTTTLADGSEGQEKTIVMLVDGGDQVTTPANFLNGTTITFADAGDAVVLRFIGSSWALIANNGAVVA